MIIIDFKDIISVGLAIIFLFVIWVVAFIINIGKRLSRRNEKMIEEYWESEDKE